MDEVKKIGGRIGQLDLLNCLLFLVSPLLALPTIFAGIYKKKQISLYLLIIFASLITYQLVPADDYDLYQFYRFYKDVKNLDFDAFFKILLSKPDFMVYLAIYLFAKAGLSGQVVFSICTFFTLHLIYLVYNKFALREEISNKYYVLGLITVFFSFELLGLYSGIRNILAAAIVLYSFHEGLFENKKMKGLLLFVLAVFTHFSVLLFFPVYFFIIIKPLKRKTVLIFYLVSFLFLFLTKEYLYNMAIQLPLTEAIDKKIKSYLLGLDFTERGNLKSIAALISYKIRVSWIYFANAYILITYKRNSNYRDLVVMLMGLLNIFSVAPDIHMRLTYLIELLFIYLLYYEYKYRHNKLFIILFFIFLIPSFVVNVMVYRDYFMNSLFNVNFLTLIGILMKKVELVFLW